MRRLSPREARLLAIALLIGVIAIIGGLGIAPIVVGFVERAQDRADLESQYRHYARLLGGAATWRDLASRQAAGAGAFALVADSAAAAATALQSRLNDALAQDGGTVTAIAERESADPNWVRIGADAELTLPQLYHSLVRLEGEEPHVVVEALAVTAGAAPGGTGPLAIRIEIAAPVLVRPAGAEESHVPATAVPDRR